MHPLRLTNKQNFRLENFDFSPRNSNRSKLLILNLDTIFLINKNKNKSIFFSKSVLHSEEAQLSPNFHRASQRSRLFYFFLPRWETVATLRSNKSVFPLQTTYAVALTLPSSLRYQAGSQGRVENEMPGRPVSGDGGREVLHYSPFLIISSIHRRYFFFFFSLPA